MAAVDVLPDLDAPEIEPVPAATVALLRDSDRGLEVLLLRRNSKLVFHGGAWVFPGGRVETDDEADDGDLGAARRAAVRETREEAGIDLDPGALLPLSHWTTPHGRPRRFATWFFLGLGSEQAINVDGGEIDDHRWRTPAEAIADQAAGEIELPPPTFVTLSKLGRHDRAGDVLDAFRDREPLVYIPRITKFGDGACALYPGDPGWEATDPEREGPRHRLLIDGTAWRYVDER